MDSAGHRGLSARPPRRKYWGWGLEGEELGAEELASLAEFVRAQFQLSELVEIRPPPVDELELPRPRLAPPDALAACTTSDTYERACHSYGKSYRDVVRALRGWFPHPPDVVAFPRDEAEIARLLDWCAEDEIAAIPYGGGSSVVGGIEPAVPESFAGAVSIDLRHLDRVLEIDPVSHAARIQAGVLGPALEEQLRPSELTLRHFPQSFEHSSLGGWLATRSGGHYSTVRTRIDDFAESIRMVTPAGPLETRRLPSSGAGPALDRLLLGSEGALGIITEVWMRLQERPRHRAGASLRFASFADGAAAVRELAQSGLEPASCRLLDPLEGLLSGAGDGVASLLLVAFESAHHPVEEWLRLGVDCARDRGGEVLPGREGGAASWRRSFLRMPHVRDALVRLGMLVETFESAITWERFEAFHAGVRSATQEALTQAGTRGLVTSRFTHAYPDGPAVYYTVVAPATAGAELEQWASVKEAASQAVLRLGGTITHHHAVGRDHMRWYERERPELLGSALRSVKQVLDPAGICNPGVLVGGLTPPPSPPPERDVNL
jgi:alkyldihydroxyacetonephosphate synthase